MLEEEGIKKTTNCLSGKSYVPKQLLAASLVIEHHMQNVVIFLSIVSETNFKAPRNRQLGQTRREPKTQKGRREAHAELYNLPLFTSVQSLSCVLLFVTPWTAALQASLSITNSWSPPKPMSIESVMPPNHLILCCPLLLLPSIFPSIRVFSSESALHIRWLKYWSFSFNISPSNEHPGQISSRMDWLDLLAVQGTLKSLFQHHSSKASILWCSAFFIVQLSHSDMTTGKNIALNRWTFVGKVMPLLFNMLSRLVITFLPRSKHLY